MTRSTHSGARTTINHARAAASGRGGRVPHGSGSPGSGAGPIITNVRTSLITQTSLSIGWDLNMFGTGYVEYGTNTSYGSRTTGQADYTYASHLQPITGLTAGTTYYFRIHSSGPSTAPQETTYASSFDTLVAIGPGPGPDPGPVPGAPTYTTDLLYAGAATISALQAYIDSSTVPDGSSPTQHTRVRLAAGTTFTGTAGLSLASRRYLTIDGQGTPVTYGNTGGATIHASGNGLSTANSPISASGSVNVRIINLNLKGSNPYGATNLSYNGAAVYNGAVLGEYQAGVSTYGSTDLEVNHTIISDVQGDGIYCGLGTTTLRLWMHDSTVIRNGRQGIHIGGFAQDCIVEDCLWQDISMYILDMEPNTSGSAGGYSNFIARRNDFGRYGWSTAFGNSFIWGTANSSTGGGAGTYGSVTFDNNTISGLNKGSPTNIAGVFGAYAPTQTGTINFRNNTCTRGRLPGWAVYLATGTGTANITGNTGFISSGSFVLIGGYTGTVNQSGND